jgi:hypothetical protein
MAFLGLFGVLLILALVYAPQFWVGHTMRRHSDERPDFPWHRRGDGAASRRAF